MPAPILSFSRVILMSAALILAAALAVSLVRAPTTPDLERKEVTFTPPRVRLEGAKDATDEAPATADDEEEAGRSTGPGACLTVRGTIWGALGGLADVGVVVVDAAGRRYEGTTDGEGRLQVVGLAPGLARVKGAQPGFVTESFEINVGLGADPEDLILPFLPAVTARGHVLWSTDGSPVAGARVVAAAEDTVGTDDTALGTDIWGVTETGAGGAFVLDAVPRGEVFTLTVLHHHAARQACNITRFGGEDVSGDIEIRLHPGGSVTGIVEDRSGRGVAAAWVYVFSGGEPWLTYGRWPNRARFAASLEGRTDAKGRFKIRGLRLGTRYAATAFALGYARAGNAVDLVVSEARPVIDTRLVLPFEAAIDVRVCDVAGHPIPGAGVVTLTEPMELAWAVGSSATVTDETGRVLLSQLEAGEILVGAGAPAYLGASHEVVVEEGETTQVEFRLRRGETISGTVVDAGDRPLAKIQVRAQGKRWDPEAFATTDEQGRFQLEGLAPGNYRVEAEGRGYVASPIRGIDAPEEGVRLICTRVGRVKGRLLLPPGSTKPARIQLRLWPWGTWKALNDGIFEVYVDREDQFLEIQGVGFAPFKQAIQVANGETLDLGDVHLPAGVTCRGVVVDPDGAPIVHALVVASSVMWRATHTDAAGRFQLENLSSSGFRLRAEKSAFRGREWELDQDDPLTDVHLVLAREASVRVLVLDAAGTPIVGATVLTAVVTPPSSSDNDEVAPFEDRDSGGVTDEQGYVTLWMPRGIYRVEASAAGKTIATGMATVEDDETTELVLRP